LGRPGAGLLRAVHRTARAWPRGNCVRIFVAQVLDIGAQAAQCYVPKGGRGISKKLSVALQREALK
jgi:hypothetical protein